ncbi:MAG: hypothetical protein KDK36_13405 [Leptospiraceae bacterium]|nr:hypothetical protein [Leptospiraceae bacterium]
MTDKVSEIKEICKTESNLAYFDSVFPDFPDLTPREIKQIKYFAKSKLKEIIDLLKTFKDAPEDEINSGIISIWIELRSEWIRYNAVNNYNMVINGVASSLSVLKSGFVSYLIGKIETYISEDKLEKLNDIMTKVQYNQLDD